MVWPSLPKLTFWWQGAQPAGQPAQPAQPAPAPDPAQPSEPAPAPADPAPAQDPGPAPQEGQPAPTPAPDASAEAQAPSDEDIIKQAEAELASGEGAQEGEVIVVTGSAIERNETTTPAPVSVVDKEELEASGMVAVGDILQNLPAQSNAINIQENNGGDGTTQINLRGLGADRTLVLLNGRRHVPAGLGANAAVDLNTIPLAIIKRVEVLKDGASAVYGSDALGGVVNIITRDDFDGTEANVYTGTTQRGDGTTVDVSVVTGQASEKGNVIFSAGYVDQGEVFAGEREFAEVQRVYDFEAGEEATTGSFSTPAGNVYVPDGTPVNLCDDQAGFGCTLDESTADPNDFRNFDGGGSSDVGQGDLYNFQPDNYLFTPSRRYNVFSSGNYKFHDKFRGFFEASYVNRKSTQQLAPEPLSTDTEGTPVSADSIYNPTGVDLVAVTRRMTEAGPRSTAQSIDTFRVVGGVGGRLPEELLDGWRWEASFNYGRSQTQEEKRGNFIRSRVAQALGPSFEDENGVARCGTPENPGPADCVPLNLLGGPESVTPEMVNYLTYIGTASGFNQQRTFLGQLNGPVVTTPWNGDIMLAVGGDFRQEDGGQRADPLTAVGDTTGNKENPTQGGYDVVEGFGEISIVPVRDQDWAKLLQFDAAARVVDYTTFGSAFTWKAGGMYKLPIGLAVRGTYSTAFRAPSIGDLYGGESDSFQNATDPCNTNGGASPIQDPIVAQNCAEDLGALGIEPTTFTNADGQMPTRVGGNPDLEAETAKVWTTGVVYEPTFAEGLGMSVDYFNVKIEDAIQQATAFILLSNCYSLEDRADCADITRSPTTGLITSMNDVQRNIGGTETDGIDFNINYEHTYTQVGRFRHNLEGTWLNNYDDVYPSRTIPGVGVYDLGVLPRWKFNFSTIWGYKGVGLGFNTRYIHSFRECGDSNDCTADNAEMVSRDVDANITGDVFASYALKSPIGSSSLTVGVNNVTDQDPPDIYNGFLATSDSSTYDFLGRFFYARFSQAF